MRKFRLLFNLVKDLKLPLAEASVRGGFHLAYLFRIISDTMFILHS